ncbi:MAG: hypothetical protein Kow0088_19810 [Anaerolineales bacterium]
MHPKTRTLGAFLWTKAILRKFTALADLRGNPQEWLFGSQTALAGPYNVAKDSQDWVSAVIITRNHNPKEVNEHGSNSP